MNVSVIPDTKTDQIVQYDLMLGAGISNSEVRIVPLTFQVEILSLTGISADKEGDELCKLDF